MQVQTPEAGRSWMAPGAEAVGSALMYVSDWSTNDVFVLDYPSGHQVGTLTGFDGPYGGCVDAKGDVFIANFYGGTAVEYAHGGTKILNTFTGLAEPIGCAVSPSGDLAVTNFSPGGVTIFPGAKPSRGTAYTDSDCEYQWTMGYDGRGNLIGMGEFNSVVACALMAGSQKETTLSIRGIGINFPGGTMWDGKYVALGDQEAGGLYVTGAWPATLSSSLLVSAGPESKFPNGCLRNYSLDVNPFILGQKNTPINDRRGTVLVASGQCASGPFIGYWHYPRGGDPYKTITSQPAAKPYGITVSIGT